MMNKGWFSYTLILVLLLMSACATPVGRSGRLGLLDHASGGRTGDRSARYNRSTGSVEDLAPAPDASAVLKLSGEWQWPLKNIEVSSPFGDRGQKFHQGVDLRAPMGTPVFASADGDVVYVGSKIRGYGRMVVIKHANSIYSVYAHHSKNLVKAGTHVQRGDMIARSGRSGHAHGPHLHFEIRKGTVSFDPALALNDRIRNENVDRRFASESPARRKRSSRTARSPASRKKTAVRTSARDPLRPTMESDRTSL